MMGEIPPSQPLQQTRNRYSISDTMARPFAFLTVALIVPIVVPAAPMKAQTKPASAVTAQAAAPRAIRRDVPLTNAIRRAYEAGAAIGRWAEDSQAIDFEQTFVGVAAELVFVLLNFREPNEIEIIDRGAKRDGRCNWWCASFKLRWQLGRREAIGPHAIDHASAAEEDRHGV